VVHLSGCGRHEWYETSTQVVVGVYAKGIKAEDLKVEFGEQIVCYPSISITL
jgi:hypothetical protein